MSCMGITFLSDPRLADHTNLSSTLNTFKRSLKKTLNWTNGFQPRTKPSDSLLWVLGYIPTALTSWEHKHPHLSLNIVDPKRPSKFIVTKWDSVLIPWILEVNFSVSSRFQGTSETVSSNLAGLPLWFSRHSELVNVHTTICPYSALGDSSEKINKVEQLLPSSERTCRCTHCGEPSSRNPSHYRTLNFHFSCSHIRTLIGCTDA